MNSKVMTYTKRPSNSESLETNMESMDGVDSRTTRLQRMRESQRKLRTQRKQQLEQERNRNLELQKEIEDLKKQNEELKKDLSLVLGVFDDEISGKQMEKLITESDKDFSSCFKPEDIITLEEFLELTGFKDSKNLFNDDGTFILSDIYNKNLNCLNRLLLRNGTVSIKATPLRFMKTYGIPLVKYHLEGMNIILKGKVPKCWLEENAFLPKGALSIVDVLRYIDNLPPNQLSGFNNYILASLIARRCLVRCRD